MKRNFSIIIIVSLLDIGFDVIFFDGETFLLFSCFCFVIGRLAMNLTNDTLKVASKRIC